MKGRQSSKAQTDGVVPPCDEETPLFLRKRGISRQKRNFSKQVPCANTRIFALKLKSRFKSDAAFCCRIFCFFPISGAGGQLRENGQMRSVRATFGKAWRAA